jgi:hypothetical protein
MLLIRLCKKRVRPAELKHPSGYFIEQGGIVPREQGGKL